jgi:hypothetical protein
MRHWDGASLEHLEDPPTWEVMGFDEHNTPMYECEYSDSLLTEVIHGNLGLNVVLPHMW